MKKVLWVIIISLSVVVYGTAQEYNFIKYNVQDGLPQSQIYDIFQGSKSYLWMATQGGGVCRFDGKTFETISTRDGLPSNFVQCIIEDGDDVLWFGTKTGIAAHDHESIIWSDKNDQTVYTLAEASDDELLVGTQAGVFLFDKITRTSTKLKLSRYLDNYRINDLLRVGDEWWIASSRGLVIWNGQETKRLGRNQGLLAEDIKELTLDNNGDVLVLQFSGGMSKISADDNRILQHYDYAKIRKGQSIYVTDQNDIWVSTLSEGIQMYKGHSHQEEWIEIGE